MLYTAYHIVIIVMITIRKSHLQIYKKYYLSYIMYIRMHYYIIQRTCTNTYTHVLDAYSDLHI